MPLLVVWFEPGAKSVELPIPFSPKNVIPHSLNASNPSCDAGHQALRKQYKCQK
jgi:hypothetical protein